MNSLTSQSHEAHDERLAAEIVADMFGFKLAYHETPEGRFYAVQDWVAGVAQTSEPRKHWHDIKRGAKKAKVELSDAIRQLPYKAANGRNYRMDHAAAETLYYITQRMDANTGVRDKVIGYLAKAGVITDEIRRDPEAAAEALDNIASNREYRKMLQEGFTHEEAVQWLDIREKQKQHRKVITGVWKERGARPPDFAILTNEAHAVATGKPATEHKRQLAIQDTPRNYLSAAENATIQITEYTAALLHNSRNSLGYAELSEDIEDVRPIIDAARPQIDQVFSKKPRRLPGTSGQAILSPIRETPAVPEPSIQTVTITIERSATLKETAACFNCYMGPYANFFGP